MNIFSVRKRSQYITCLSPILHRRSLYCPKIEMSVDSSQSTKCKKTGRLFPAVLTVFALITLCYFVVVFSLWKLLYESTVALPAANNTHNFQFLGRINRLLFSHVVSFLGKKYDMTLCVQHSDVIEINLAWERVIPILKNWCPSVHGNYQKWNSRGQDGCL